MGCQGCEKKWSLIVTQQVGGLSVCDKKIGSVGTKPFGDEFQLGNLFLRGYFLGEVVTN